jgi:poly(3-hydroxybutyrate) depolymerase
MASGGPYDAQGKAYNAQGNLICGNGAPVASMVVHGQADGEVSMSEGDKSLSHWRTRGGCRGTSPKMLFDTCVEYTNCTAGNAVWHCAVPGLGHGVWPRAGEAGWAFIRSLP